MSTRWRQSERDEYVRMLFRQLPGAMWTTDRDLRLTYVAGRFANNMSPMAKPGMLVDDIVGTHDQTNQFIAHHRAALSGKPQSFDTNLNGRYYQVFIEQLKEGNGAVAGCIAAAFDMTDQHNIQQRLAQSEALHAQAQRLAHIGSFEWDLVSGAVTWSEELHRIYGVEPGRFGGTYEAFLDCVHPEDLERTKSTIFDAIRKGTPFIYEHRIRRKDGGERVLQTRGDVIREKDGRVVLLAGCCLDVTELRNTMDTLERTRSLLEATIEATADGLLVINKDRSITLHNQRFISLWKIPPQLANDRSHEKLLEYASDQLEDPEQFLHSTRELYGDPEHEIFDVQHFKDGRVFERYSRAQLIGKEAVGRVWSFRDITEREILFQRAMFLADATRLLTSLDIEPALESVARMAVPFMGESCAIDLFRSGQPRRVAFYSIDEVESRPDLLPAAVAGHSAIYSIGTRSCMAVPIIVKEGVAGAITFVRPPFQPYVKSDLEFAETLASRAALSIENASLYEKTQQAIKARDEFLAIAAHEIRGPITSIHLAVQTMHAQKVSPSDMSILYEIIEREDRRLSTFVSELVDLGKIRSGQIQFNLEEVDFGDVVREAASSLASDLTQSRSALSMTMEGSLVGRWDKERLMQVATSLLSNAIKFGDGKPIVINLRENAGVTTLEVTDHGIGIQPDMLARIFDPFERAVSLRNYGGLGLGLFITHTIVQGLGGTIRVKSKPEEGSTFSVELRNAVTL